MILISVIGGSCVKDPLIIPEDGCYNFPSSQFGYNYIQSDTSFEAPFYNKSNSNEVFYTRHDHAVSNSTELRRRNISTGADNFVVSGVWGQSKINSAGWILFNHADNQVWKVKSNGDSLTQLTFSGLNHSACWNPAGDRFVYRHELGAAFYAIVADANGNPIDTLDNFNYAYGDWSPDGTRISCWEMSGGLPTVIYYDLTDSTIHQLASLSEENNFISAQNWSGDGAWLYITAVSGIYRVKLSDQSVSLIQSCCDSKVSIFLSLSPNGSKMAVQRINSWREGDNDVRSEEVIVEMNPDGSGERKIIE